MYKKILLSFLFFIMVAAPLSVSAQSFRDVPPNHFAFEAINWVSDPDNGAFMVGNARNNFRPSDNTTKFEAAQIFAMAAGFRPGTSGVPVALRNEMARSFEIWRSFLESMSQTYTRWDTRVDREIAFLLYRDILTTGDVIRFVNRVGSNESPAVLSREEAVTWLVRLSGRSAHANATSLPVLNPFNDDSLISNQFMRYVYFAREAGIITPHDNYFNPTASLTRAELAVLFHATLADEEDETPLDVNNLTTMTGVIIGIDNSHLTFNYSGNNRRLRIATNVTVIIDGRANSTDGLAPDMPASVLMDANRLVLSIVATTAENRPAAAAEPNLTRLEGLVSNINNNRITLETRQIGITGQITEDERSFYVNNNADITANDVSIPLRDVEVGNIAIVHFNNQNIYRMEVLQANRTISGSLSDIIFETGASYPTLVIQKRNSDTYNLDMTSLTTFTRNGDSVGLSQLRIGDTIEADVEMDRLLSVYATSQRRTVEGRLSQISISETKSTIVVNTGSESQTLIIRAGDFDVFTLRIGTRLRLSVESNEVLSVQVIGNSGAALFVGVVTGISEDEIVLNELPAMRSRTLVITPSTRIRRGAVTLTYEELDPGMNIMVTLVNANSDEVHTISILP